MNNRGPGPRPVLIDTDPGVDDALALILAAAAPEIRVVAVTTVGGNVSVDQVTRNACRVVPVAWSQGMVPPVFRGLGGKAATAEEVHGGDGLGGVPALMEASGRPMYPAMPAQTQDGVSAILAAAERFRGQLTIIALGPLTNLAAALQRDPELAGKVRQVVVMGGAFRVPGNVGRVAEFNVFVDPEAAQAVCESGLPVTWVPIDVTQHCLLRLGDLEALPEKPQVRFAIHITRAYMDYHFRAQGEWACYLHDPTAVACVLWPELFQRQAVRVDVETEGRFTRGMTVADFREDLCRQEAPNAEVCLHVEAEVVVSRFLERIAAASRVARSV